MSHRLITARLIKRASCFGVIAFRPLPRIRHAYSLALIGLPDYRNENAGLCVLKTGALSIAGNMKPLGKTQIAQGGLCLSLCPFCHLDAHGYKRILTHHTLGPIHVVCDPLQVVYSIRATFLASRLFMHFPQVLQHRFSRLAFSSMLNVIAFDPR